MPDGSLSGRIAAAPSDPIFGIVEAFRTDPRPHKINLAAGIYMDESGATPILPSVRAAEAALLAAAVSKVYVPIAGDPAYLDAVRNLLFRAPDGPWGATIPPVAEGRVDILHTPGGTGAVRLAVDLLGRLRPSAAIWVGEPTWPNHQQIVEAARATLRRYSWLTADARELDRDAIFEALEAASPGDAFVFHGACHNPSGIDPDPALWQQIAARVAERGLVPILDVAYLGFGSGLVEDAASLRAFAATGCELLVASSASKNFALYNERVGALALVGATPAATKVLASHARMAVRTAWSNPPAHGGAIVSSILGDPASRAQWEGEVAAMRERIAANRRDLVAALAAAGLTGFERLLRHRGMFSLLGLSDAQLARLREEHAIYLVAQGRINMAGLSASKAPIVARAVAQVLA